MRIKDIVLDDVAQGKNWRLVGSPADRSSQPMEEWAIEPAPDLHAGDDAVYSTIYVRDDGEVEPRLLIKEVASPEWSGDICEFADGSWRQAGLVPNPDAPFGQDYVANPHPEDPSFIEAYDHASQATNFTRHVSRMRRT